MSTNSFLAAMALVIAPLAGAEADAAPIAPVGTTEVTVTSDVLGILTTAGIAASPIAPAVQSLATFSFPITGGDTEPLLVTHSGGVRLDDGTSFIEVSDFVIDATVPGISGTVFGSAADFTTPGSAGLFDLSAIEAGPPLTANLVITPTLNSALGSTFFSDLPEGQRPALAGLVFGTASTNPVPNVAPVPLPAGAPLLLAGLGAIALLRRRAV